MLGIGQKGWNRWLGEREMVSGQKGEESEEVSLVRPTGGGSQGEAGTFPGL